jgi:hypothetical protein
VNRKRVVLGLGAAGLAVVLTTAALLVEPAATARAEAQVPAPDEVLARVDRGTPAPRAREDLPAALQQARADVERARRDGDPRYLGRAQAVLAPWWELASPPDAVLLLRATIRQSLHDFAGARADLDRLIARSPGDAQARLTRATVATVTGDLAQAEADCEAIAPRAGALITEACLAPLAPARGDAAAALARLDTAIAAAPDAAPSVMAWARAAAAELARELDRDDDAEAHLRAALVALPDDAYALAALADLLLDGERAGEVIALLADRDASDNLLLRLAIAEHATGAPGAAEHAALLRERFAAQLERGDRTHLREQARFALAIDGDACDAMALAVEGWALQKESADARILREASAACLGGGS